MRAYLDFVSGTLVLGVTLATTLVLLFAVFPALPIGGEMLDVKAGYTHPEVIAEMEGYGNQGRRVYAWSAATLDTLLPGRFRGAGGDRVPVHPVEGVCAPARPRVGRSAGDCRGRPARSPGA